MTENIISTQLGLVNLTYPLCGHFSALEPSRSSREALHPPLEPRHKEKHLPWMTCLILITVCVHGFHVLLTVVTVVINQNDLFHQLWRAFLQDTEAKIKENIWWSSRKGLKKKKRIFNKQVGTESFCYLTTVRSRAERASLWKVMTTLEAGRSEFHCLCLQLHTKSQFRNIRRLTKSTNPCTCALIPAHKRAVACLCAKLWAGTAPRTDFESLNTINRILLTVTMSSTHTGDEWIQTPRAKAPLKLRLTADSRNHRAKSHEAACNMWLCMTAHGFKDLNPPKFKTGKDGLQDMSWERSDRTGRGEMHDDTLRLKH